MFHNNRLPHFQVFFVEINQRRTTLISALDLSIHAVTARLTKVNNKDPWIDFFFSLNDI